MTLSSRRRPSTSIQRAPHNPAFGTIGPFESTFAAIPPSLRSDPSSSTSHLTSMAQVYPAQRPTLRRHSPLSVFRNSQGFVSNPPMLQNIAVEDDEDLDDDDSSEDDAPPPVKFSALTNALLASQPPHVIPEQYSASTSPLIPTTRERTNRPNPQLVATHEHSSLGQGHQPTSSSTPLPLRRVKASSPALAGTTSSRSPRVVRVSSDGFQRPTSPGQTPIAPASYSYITPAPVSRLRASSNESLAKESDPDSHEASRYLDTQLDGTSDDREEGPSSASARNDTGYHTTSYAARNRGVTEHQIPTSQLRIRRARIGAGSLLSGAPVRRGFKPRDSDAVPSSQDHTDAQNDHTDDHLGRIDLEKRDSPVAQILVNVEPEASVQPRDSPARVGERDTERSEVRPVPGVPSELEPISEQNHLPDDVAYSDAARQELIDKYKSFRSRSLTQKPQVTFKPSIPPTSTRPQTEAEDDQENMPPPTFKRNKDQSFDNFGTRSEKSVLAEHEKTPIRASKQPTPRKILAPLSENTPRRQAPQPPPKMSILDAATKSAGAATTKSRKKRQHVVFKGQTYTQLRRIGYGGSAQVYCVMAENGTMYALKKVKLDSVNESALAGFLGEVKLLLKFQHSDRVVRLIGHELDTNKQQLSLLMELGDHDFARFLNSSQNDKDGRLDTVMVRYYWKEMLECVQAAHDLDIVHSDLKPANFLSKEGRLKLIDFGIANAIDVEHTVNVHREGMVGTTNYMSPESLTNTNEVRPDQSPGTQPPRPVAQDMRLGKPSDIWSLGCVLYQMVYGTPPFAHISNPIHRCLAIPNPKVPINFPSTGLGDVPVPQSLLDTLRACLQRDPSSRPTAEQLLSPYDAFLYPDARPKEQLETHKDNERGNDVHGDGSVQISEDLLSRIVANAIERCKKGSLQSSNEVRQFSDLCLRRIRDLNTTASRNDATTGGHAI